MNFIMQLFGIPLGWVMHMIYRVIPNYGIALLVFTLLSRVLLFPVALKQQQSTAKMAVLQPRIKDIQKKYANDQVMMREEINKLYAEENYNTMSGCLPLLVQMPILFGLIDVIYRPLTHILRLPKEVIAKAVSLFHMLGLSPTNPNMLEMEVIAASRAKPLFFGTLGTAALTSMTAINFNFLGMNLMTSPSFSMLTGIFSGAFDPVIFIPLMSGATAYLMSALTMKQTAATSGEEGAGMMKGMMYTMPLMSLWIAFTVPAGVGLYWVYSNVFGILQNMYINKFHNPKELQEKLKAEQAERKEKEHQDHLEARKLHKAGLLNPELAEKAMTQKEKDSQKLADARKRQAEKYGETYSEEK